MRTELTRTLKLQLKMFAGCARELQEPGIGAERLAYFKAIAESKPCTLEMTVDACLAATKALEGYTPKDAIDRNTARMLRVMTETMEHEMQAQVKLSALQISRKAYKMQAKNAERISDLVSGICAMAGMTDLMDGTFRHATALIEAEVMEIIKTGQCRDDDCRALLSNLNAIQVVTKSPA